MTVAELRTELQDLLDAAEKNRTNLVRPPLSFEVEQHPDRVWVWVHCVLLGVGATEHEALTDAIRNAKDSR